jgi:hypothetical protein
MVAPRNPNRLAVDTEAAVGLQLPGRPAWFADALCREYPHLDWVDAERNKADKATCLDVCGRCAVVIPCREYAIADGSLVGLWGGCDTVARKAIRRNREVQAS